jgi:peptidyl-prolyl cis-trans isomerase SurA
MLLSAILLAALWPTAHAGERQVVEEIVARVNNEIITLSDLERSRQLLRQELNQRNSGAELERLYQEQEPNLLRDLIDQQLLVQRALDRGLSVESEVIKRLDQIRQDMKLTSMEELERAMAAQGMSMEDFTTEGYPASQLPAREERVREVIVKIRQGEDFEELAREYSDAPTAEQGGELGYFEPDKLAPSIREAIGNLLEEGVSDAIRTREGWLLLQLVEHRPPGIPPFEDVESRIRDQLYMAEVQPALREFLNDLRREAFVYVKTGYQDSGEVEEEARPVRAGSRRSKRRRRPD